MYEVFAVGHMLCTLCQINLPQIIGYSPGHARGMFVGLASKYGALERTDVAFVLQRGRHRQQLHQMIA